MEQGETPALGEGTARASSSMAEAFASVFEHVPVPVAISTLQDGTYLAFNRAFADLIGCSRSEAIGRTSVELGVLEPEDRRRVVAALKEHGELRRYPMRFRCRDGRRRTGLFSAQILGEAEGKVLLSSLLDVTELLEADEKLREANRRLEQRVAERTQELELANRERELLLHSVSHDLRNPLGVARYQLRMLDSAASSWGPDERRRLQAAGRALERIGRLLEDLVDLARFESEQMALELRPVEIRAFLEEAVASQSGALPVHRVLLELPGDLPSVLADPARLERVVVNLLGNALKYSPGEAPVRVGARRVGDAVEVSVRDEGPGLPADVVPHLFERFYRAPGTRSVPGLGLGLFICRRLVEAHGGRIWVESLPGAGSTFLFSVPVVATGL